MEKPTQSAAQNDIAVVKFTEAHCVTDATTTTLRKIEDISSGLEMRGRWIADDVNELVNLPSWETNAEDKLAEAEHRLRRTLQIVQQARALMLKKRPLMAAE